MKTEVFISHSSQDRDWANALCAHLESRRIRCWIAPRDVPAGAIWAEAIIDGIENTRVMVLLVSSHANASRQVIHEVERAVSKGVIVMPVRLESVKPSKGLEYFLGSRHWLDALTPPVERRIEEIGAKIEHVLTGPPPPPTPPVPSSPPRRMRARTMLLFPLVAVGAGALWWWRTRPPREPAAPAIAETAPVVPHDSGAQPVTRGAAGNGRNTPAEEPPPGVAEDASPSRNPPATTAVDAATEVTDAEVVRPETRPAVTKPDLSTLPTPPLETANPRVDAVPSSSGIATPGGPAPGDIVLPNTIWVGAMMDSTGASSECITVMERRMGDRVTVEVYFPGQGAMPQRWNGTLRQTEFVLTGNDAERQRLTFTARVANDRLIGTWESSGGRRGTFTFAQITGHADTLLAGSGWSGPLRVNQGGELHLNLRVTSRQHERINGRCTVRGERGETPLYGVLLGDRFFGTLQNLPVQGTQRVALRFTATVRDDAISGTWSSDAGLSGTVAWLREP